MAKKLPERRQRITVAGADEEAARVVGNLKKNLAWIVDDRGLSYQMLERMTGLSSRTVYEWITDDAEPSPSKLCQLGQALGIAFEDFWLPPATFKQRYQGTASPPINLVVRPFVRKGRSGKNVVTRTSPQSRTDQRGPSSTRPIAS